MRNYILASLAIAGVGILVLITLSISTLRHATNTPSPVTPTRPVPTAIVPTDMDTVNITIGDTIVTAEVAANSAQLEQGLSGRPALPDGTGMLFIMGAPARHKFWMPDMHFSIDIIWLDAQLRVVDTTEHATPKSYPRVFMPDVPALYALEVPSGFVETHGIVGGTVLSIDN